MILTQCAACAAPLPLLAKQCSRCQTRYCGPACQEQHWKEGGHDKLCKKIKRGGGAEQYHANEKYAVAVAVAAEACVEDTKGQTCFICTQALHWKTKEGLVRGCACRGTAGFAHVSCLAEQAKILVEEAGENNLFDTERGHSSWARWHTCSLCEQRYHGVVVCALGWACWKTYVSLPEEDALRMDAMSLLGNGLSGSHCHEDALSVGEAELAMERRLGASEENMLVVQANLACVYRALGRFEEALHLQRILYSGRLKINGEGKIETFVVAVNYASSLVDLQRFEEAKALLRKTTPVARRFLGEGHRLVLKLQWHYALALRNDTGATLGDLREAVTTLEESERIGRRVFGISRPLVTGLGDILRDSRAAIRAREASVPGEVTSICEAVDAMATGDA